MYALVFVARYLDLFFSFISLYNTVMKMIFLGTTLSIVHTMMRHKSIKNTYDREHDSFRVEFIVGPCAVLALLLHSQFTFVEVLWTFSIYLEAVAILPQLVLLQRTKNIDNLTGNYVFLLGLYRGLYIVNWVWRYFTERGYTASRTTWIVWISGLIQTAIYGDFFYYYLQSWKANARLRLPS